MRNKRSGKDETTAVARRQGIPRPLEVTVATAGLLVCVPILAISAVVIVLTSRGPALFRQARVGLDGRLFHLYKLRTMRHSVEGPEVTARGDARVTWIGRFLRKTKLDELPELWNVVKGDMSLVGPRPEVPRHVNLDNPRWQVVLKARPGITDPVTLRLRNEETLLAGVEGSHERFYLETLLPFKLDGYVEYLRTRTLWYDVKVLLKTALAVALPRKAQLPALEEIKTKSNRQKTLDNRWRSAGESNRSGVS